ncbi:hypothetical protein E2C01_005821 [Portunus trituberculatus]|uniref:Uncharacterized protein n=1 Tax=Portunus trituberculatus TaxID=210409 RepID=A0A5B7CW17_PORTR|nr:hypothetical protein [Portunus trituberculatus]
MPLLLPLRLLLPSPAPFTGNVWGVRTSALVVVLLVLLSGRGSGSEFPDRECCDSAPPPPPHYHTVTSTSTTTTTTTTQQPPTYGEITNPLVFKGTNL